MADRIPGLRFVFKDSVGRERQVQPNAPVSFSASGGIKSCPSPAYRARQTRRGFPADALQRFAEILEAIEALLDDVEACRVAEPDRAVVAKGDTGNNRHVGLAQKPISEILRLQSKSADVDEDIERPKRPDGPKSRDFAQRSNMYSLRISNSSRMSVTHC